MESGRADPRSTQADLRILALHHRPAPVSSPTRGRRCSRTLRLRLQSPTPMPRLGSATQTPPALAVPAARAARGQRGGVRAGLGSRWRVGAWTGQPGLAEEGGRAGVGVGGGGRGGGDVPRNAPGPRALPPCASRTAQFHLRARVRGLDHRRMATHFDQQVVAEACGMCAASCVCVCVCVCLYVDAHWLVERCPPFHAALARGLTKLNGELGRAAAFADVPAAGQGGAGDGR